MFLIKSGIFALCKEKNLKSVCIIYICSFNNIANSNICNDVEKTYIILFLIFNVDVNRETVMDCETFNKSLHIVFVIIGILGQLKLLRKSTS